MNQLSASRPVLTFIATVVLALGSAAAIAQDAAPKTRAQVRAELVEARAKGTLPMGGEFAGVMAYGPAKSADAATSTAIAQSRTEPAGTDVAKKQ
jgi:hypothetical protein